MSNPVLNKIESMERCINRVKEIYSINQNLNDYNIQDALILNLQRACQTAIDIAMHIIARETLGLPQNSKEAFTILETNKIINFGTSKNMKAMVGFRNIIVHEYEKLNIDILQSIVENNLNDFIDFSKDIIKYENL